MRLIDKDQLEEAVQDAINILRDNGVDMTCAHVPLDIIKGAPTIDAIPVMWLLDSLEEILNSGVLSGKPDDNLNIRSIIQVLRLWGIKLEVKA